MSLVEEPSQRGFSTTDSTQSNYSRQANAAPATAFPLCDLPLLTPHLPLPPTHNGRFGKHSSHQLDSNTEDKSLQSGSKTRLELPNGPTTETGPGFNISKVHGGEVPVIQTATSTKAQLRHLGITTEPALGCVTAPNSGKIFGIENGSERIFFPPESDEVDPRFQSIRDTSFSWESIDSQVGSRQSLLDNKGRSRLIKSCSKLGTTQGPWQGAGGCSGDAGGDAMDLTRRQREQRKKDIRSKFDLANWSSERSHADRRCCNWTFVFDPSGRLVYYWSVVVSLAFLYNFWVIIYRTAFDEIQGSTVLIWFSLDYLADFIYLMDILIHFRTAYLEDGVLQTETIKLRQHYMNSTTFYIDLLCLLPLDFLYLSLEFQSMLRVCRLVKIYRFWEFLDRTERHTNYPNLFRLLSLVHYLLVAFHWNSCIFYKLHKGTGFGSGNNTLFGQEFPDLAAGLSEMEGIVSRGKIDNVDGGDIEFAREIAQQDITKLYLMSYYWTILAMTTVGNLPHPTTKVQYFYVIFQLLAGIMVFATVLGYVASIVSNISAARKDFQAKLDGVKTYMRIRKVPSNIQVKVIKWFDYLWLSQKSSDEEKSINCLPDKLKGEIAIHVHLDTLKRVEIFQNTEAGFLCELVLRLRPVLFSPGDYICRKGEVGKEMYICTRGRLQVVDTDGKTVLATLKAGSYFGEISILNMGTAGNRRTASVRSVGYSDLFVLSKTDMWDVLKDYPAARVRLEAVAAKKIERYKKVPLEKAALPRSQSTPGLLESEGRVCLEDMWVSPLPLPPSSPDAGSIDSRFDRPRRTLESPLSEISAKTSTTIETERMRCKDSQFSPKPPASPRIRSMLGKKGSITSHESSECTSMVSRHGAVPPAPPQVLHVTAPTPSDHSHCSEDAEHRSLSSAYSTGEQGASPQYLSVLNHNSGNSSLRDSGTSLHPGDSGTSLHPPSTTSLFRPPCSTSPRQSIQPATTPQPEELIMEIKRLRDRLRTLESENLRMSTMINTTNRQVDIRLNEIEQRLVDGDSSQEEFSLEEEEKNQESFI